MEYTVGCIADLISGTNTPNKPKIKKVIVNRPPAEDPADKRNHSSETHTERKSRKKKSKLKVSPSNSEPNIVVIDHQIFQKPKSEDSSETNTNSEQKKKKKPKQSSEDSEESSSGKIKRRKREIKVDELDDDITLGSSTKQSSGDSEETFSGKIKKRKHKINVDESDDDVALGNSPKIKKSKESSTDKVVKHERDGRTLFVGNIPVSIKKRMLLRLFSKYGEVESVRLRCLAPAEPGMPKRVAYIKKMLHPKRLTMHSYIRFTTRDGAVKGLAANGMLFQEHHLRVQISNDATQPDPHKAIFVGSLPFDIEDDELWSTFESCGPIVSVRIVRDSKTNMGVGIGYVNFESSDAVELALQMENVMIKNHQIRIFRYSSKKQTGQKNRRNTERRLQHKKTFKRPKNYPGNPPSGEENTDKVMKTPFKKQVFQGSKTNVVKKKPKLNKDVVRKLKISKQIAPR